MAPRKATPVPIPEVWSSSVGELRQRVTVREEPTRGWRLYLWWRTPGGDERKPNWGKESLRTTLRDREHYFLPDVVARQTAATAALAKKYGQLYGSEPGAPVTAPAPKPAAAALTIGGTEAVITDPKTGLYPHDTTYRDEVLRALKFAALAWGAEKEWNALERSDWTSLIRQRLEQLLREQNTGIAGTQHTVIRLITVIRWLKEEGKIAEAVPMPKRDWKEKLASYWSEVTKSKRAPAVHRPRYTIEELLKILAAAWEIDPRFGLLAHLGAGLRLGQVRRSMRSDLRLVTLEDGDVWELTVHSAGKKGGTVVELTPGQRALLEAVLADLYAPLEQAWQDDKVDYPLFPAGRLQGLEGQQRVEETAMRPDRPSRRARSKVRLSKRMALERSVSNRWWQKRWRQAETLADVPYIEGRASYGGRRVFVDEALDLEVGDRALKSLGGWTSASVPKGVYADKESRKGRREARDARVSILGEGAQVGIHSGAARTTDVPESERPATESGTPGEASTEGQSNP